MFISPAFAQTASGAAANPTLGMLIQIAPWVLILGAFWFLLMRPQQQEQKRHKARLKTLKRGDKVVTAGGIVGTVKKAAEGADQIDVEIAPNITVTIVRSTITTVTEVKSGASGGQGG